MPYTVEVEAQMWAMYRRVGQRPHIWNDRFQLCQFASAYAYYKLHEYLCLDPPEAELAELKTIVKLADLTKLQLLAILGRHCPAKAKKSRKRVVLYKDVRALGVAVLEKELA